MSVPMRSTAAQFSGASCSSPTTCTAVGQRLQPGGLVVSLVEQWDGSSWVTQDAITPANAGAGLDSVSCDSGSVCTAVGYVRPYRRPQRSFAEQSTDSGWEVQSTPIPDGAGNTVLKSASCASSTSCAAVGYSYFQSSGARPAPRGELGRRVVDAWERPRPVGAMATALYGVSCTATSACTAVGYSKDGSGTQSALVERWVGIEFVDSDNLRPPSARLKAPCPACRAQGRQRARPSASIPGDVTATGAQMAIAESWNGSRLGDPARADAGWRVPQLLLRRVMHIFVGVHRRRASRHDRGNGHAGRCVGRHKLDNSEYARPDERDVHHPPRRVVYIADGVYRGRLVRGHRRHHGDVGRALGWQHLDDPTHPPNPAGSIISNLAAVSCLSASMCVAAGSGFTSGHVSTTLAEDWNGHT